MTQPTVNERNRVIGRDHKCDHVVRVEMRAMADTFSTTPRRIFDSAFTINSKQ